MPTYRPHSSIHGKRERKRMFNNSIKLNREQRRAYTLMHRGRNVFVSGSGGTGKTAILRAYIQENQNSRNTAFLAPTGMAARNINGTTIHRFFRLHAGTFHPNYADSWYDEQMVSVLKATRHLVIDEIGMVRSDIFSTMEAICRRFPLQDRQWQAFGGRAVSVLGDFLQLPPVVTSEEDEEYLIDNYGGVYAFETEAWKKANFRACMLQTVHRQAQDQEYLSILNRLREGDAAVIERLNRRLHFAAVPPGGATCLCATRRDAHAINCQKDAELPGLPYTVRGMVQGSFDQQHLPTPTELRFKRGSRVMLVKNRYTDCGQPLYVNGDMGSVVDVHQDDTMNVYVELDCGKLVQTSWETWLEYDYAIEYDSITNAVVLTQVPIGFYRQLPLSLAYALTVHKSQGASLDRVHVNLNRGMFAGGQLYTALSRCRSLRGLSVDRPVTENDLYVDPAVLGFYGEIECETSDNIDQVLHELYGQNCFHDYGYYMGHTSAVEEMNSIYS